MKTSPNAETVDDERDGWTVKAEDYDRLAEAARGLRCACRDRLPPGHYAKLDEECRAIDALLSQNTKVCHGQGPLA